MFALSHHELGCFSETQHHIELTDNTPIRQKYRRIPPHLYQAVKEELSKLLENGVIQESTSPYASPISIAIKKDGSPRVCLDFRKLNLITRKDAKAIPNIDELIDNLRGKKIFSSLDMMQGYHQLELDKSSRECTAFNAGPLGFYEYCRLPFGITNASASFQRMMEYVLRDLLSTVCMVYIDDVVVHSNSARDHIADLQKVFACLERFNLKLKPSKCKFFCEKLCFLGHVISSECISADPEKVKAIKDWEPPQTVKQVRQFQGMVGYLRRYIKNFSNIAEPITRLLSGYSNKKGNKAANRKLEQQKFHWGPEQQTAFELLKNKVSKDVVLAYPDFEKTFRLSCNASRNGLGAVLDEEQDDMKFRPIAFASRRTSATEKQYPIHSLEFLSLKWSVTEKFKDYLRTKPFVCYTDNNPLTYVFKTAKLDATAQRWVAQLEPYDFIVKYKPGVTNTVADDLSRKYDTEEYDNTQQVKDWASKHSEGFEEEAQVAATTIQNTLDLHPTVNYNWKTLQETDETISAVKRVMTSNENTVPDISHSTKNLLKEKEKLKIHRNLLYFQQTETSPKRIVVPQQQHEEITKLYHSFGHFGITRSYKILKERFFWVAMKQTVIEICTMCERCQKAKTVPTKNKGPLTHIQTPSRPMYQLSIDFLQIDTRAQTKCKILTCVDEFTKFAFGIIIKSENVEKTAEQLYKQIYTKYGIPEVVHSDRGATFLSKVLRELNKILGITHTVTTAYRPQSNGTCERLNGTIIDRIRTLNPREKPRWHMHLDSLILAYNSTVHESIGISPFYAMFGRQPKIPLDLLVRLPDPELNPPTSVKSFASNRQHELKDSFELMTKNIENRRERSKINFDNKIKNHIAIFKRGDKVLVRKFVRKNKVDDRFQAEIHDVISKKDEVPLYLIKGLESGTIKTIHRDHLILFKESTTVREPTPTIHEIVTWDNMKNKSYERDPDEDYQIKKQLNQKVALHFGESINIQSDYKLVIDNTTSEADIDKNIKTASENKFTSAIITVKHNCKKKVRITLQYIRRELSRCNWTKFIISTQNHVIYNMLIEEMCTVFPKTNVTQVQQNVSESDDDSDEEFMLQPQPDVINRQQSDESDQATDIEHESDDIDSDSSVEEVRPGHGYNLRRAGRRPPRALKDFLTFTLIPQYQ